MVPIKLLDSVTSKIFILDEKYIWDRGNSANKAGTSLLPYPSSRHHFSSKDLGLLRYRRGSRACPDQTRLRRTRGLRILSWRHLPNEGIFVILCFKRTERQGVTSFSVTFLTRHLQKVDGIDESESLCKLLCSETRSELRSGHILVQRTNAQPTNLHHTGTAKSACNRFSRRAVSDA